jgi:hypothetical protein
MEKSSILFEPAALAVLVNENALDDLQLFFDSLAIWNINPPPIYMFCTKVVDLWCKGKYKGMLYTKQILEPYRLKSRKEMESLPSKKGLPNLFYDFTQEKCDLVLWALENLNGLGTETLKRGILFCDVDIFWTAPLPKIPKGKTLALSPHYIRKHDEEKFGAYNAGFLWTNDVAIPMDWKRACETSRFFEQAALEDLEKNIPSENLHLFGPEHNFGWWRLFQSAQSPEQQKARWTIHRDRDGKHSGLLVDKEVLTCVHTHFKTDDFITKEFNKWFTSQLNKIASSQPKVKALLKKIV